MTNVRAIPRRVCVRIMKVLLFLLQFDRTEAGHRQTFGQMKEVPVLVRKGLHKVGEAHGNVQQQSGGRVEGVDDPPQKGQRVVDPEQNRARLPGPVP